MKKSGLMIIGNVALICAFIWLYSLAKMDWSFPDIYDYYFTNIIWEDTAPVIAMLATAAIGLWNDVKKITDAFSYEEDYWLDD